jgi:5-methyltetrahydropteroyltriglutamate--homocysteine methyltransferase
LPSFKFQIVGSLLRPSELLKYKTQIEHRDGISYPFYEDFAGYETCEAEAIKDVVNKEIEHGLSVITDGEYSKLMWHLDFVWGFEGVEREEQIILSKKFKEFHEHAGDRETKLCVPSPSHIFGELSWSDNIGGKDAIYKNRQELKAGLVKAYKEFVGGFADLGGKIIQFDDCLWGLFADDNPNSPGNYDSRNMGGGSYVKIANLFLRQLKYDRFFLEWDDERAGSLEALAVFKDRPDTEIILSLLSSKTNTLDDEERVVRLLNEAATIIDKGRLFLSHQCGFASCDGGNELTEDEQWAKINQGQRIAKQYWQTQSV